MKYLSTPLLRAICVLSFATFCGGFVFFGYLFGEPGLLSAIIAIPLWIGSEAELATR